MPLNRSDELSDRDIPLEAAEHAAADWFIKHDCGLPAAQSEEFARWLQADERHAVIYAEMGETWDRLRDAPARSTSSLFVSHRWRQVWIPLALATAAVLAVTCVTWRAAKSTAAAPFSEFVSTDNVMRRVDLPDGSVLQLNVETAVEVRLTPAERRVRLVRGEANFQVAKNPARPFIVHVGGVEVRAVGTAFNVRLRPEAVEVLVTEGKVRVDDEARGKSLLAASVTGGTPLLVAGQLVRIPIDRDAIVMEFTPMQIEKALAWQERRLKFDSEPLANVVAEFNRYNRHKLVIADSRLAERRFGGTFPTGDYEGLVRLLEMNFGVVAERRENETLLRLGP